MNYNIIASGSSGNAIMIGENILIECGLPFKHLKDHINNLKYVFLTHIHSDHFNPSTIKKIHDEKPLVKFICGHFLVAKLIDIAIDPNRIELVHHDMQSTIGNIKVKPFNLFHDVPNYGYNIKIDKWEMIYATDTSSLFGVEGKSLDLYMIEANYEEDEIWKRIRKKEKIGLYPYEYNVLKNHLSKQKADEFIKNNASIKSKIVYMHQHVERDCENE
jgi:phosphoribosyl 1,2-cyclic phosphodiesterase